jgi:hypothetical protein
VSELALVYRLHKLQMLSDWQYRSLCIQISQDGGRTSELSGMGERETSQVLAKVFAALREDGIHKTTVARELGLPTRELNKLVFGLVLSAIDGAQEAAEDSDRHREPLRLA